MHKKNLLVLWLFSLSLCLFAQGKKNQMIVFPQPLRPEQMDNYQAVMFYSNSSTAFNLQGRAMAKVRGEIRSIKVNPAGHSYALLSVQKGRCSVTLLTLGRENEVLFRFKGVEEAKAICFSSDARSFLISVKNGINVYNLANYDLLAQYQLDESPISLCPSENGYYLAGVMESRRVVIWDIDTMTPRQEFQMDAPVSAIAFSQDNSLFAILAKDGILYLYDAHTFQMRDVIKSLGEGRDLDFHPNGKYIAVVQDEKSVVVVNTMDVYDRYVFEDAERGIAHVRIAKDNLERNYLIYNTNYSISYRLLDDLRPNYLRLLEDELSIRIDAWQQMMPGETLDEYHARVNEETLAQQVRLMEEEIATFLAGDLVSMDEIMLGSYNNEHNLLAINFSTMPPIYLPVPESEVGSFRDTGGLEFKNVRYALTKSDKFEVVYAEVFNRHTGKTYFFDNRERRTLSLLYSEEQFVPLEYVQQASMEEVLLSEIKEKVVDMARQDNVITDQTIISLKAHVVPDYDVNGKRIWNYEVGFNYDVTEDYSSRDDFSPGKYLVEESAAAMSMLAIVEEAFRGSLAQYVVGGKKLKVRITGSADAAPVRNMIPYSGSYGDFVNEPIFKDGNLSSVSVTKSQGVESNEQLAFLRAVGVRDYIEKNILSIGDMQTDFFENVEVSKNRGGAYRRISVVFTFVDAF